MAVRWSDLCENTQNIMKFYCGVRCSCSYYCYFHHNNFLNILIHLLLLLFWPWHGACEILAPWPRIEPMPPAVQARSLNHWSSREAPHHNNRWCFLQYHSWLTPYPQWGPHLHHILGLWLFFVEKALTNYPSGDSRVISSTHLSMKETAVNWLFGTFTRYGKWRNGHQLQWERFKFRIK